MTRTPTQLKGAAIVFGLLLGVQDVRAAKAELDRAVASRDAGRVGERLYIADPLFVVKAWRDRWAACLTSAWCYVPPPTPSAPPPAPSLDLATVRPSPAVQACYDSSERAIAEAFGGREPLGTVALAQLECDRRLGGLAPLTDRLLTIPPADSAPRVSQSTSRRWWSTLWLVVVARWAVLPLVQTGWALFSLGWTARIVFALALLVGLQVARVAARRSDTLASYVVFSLASFLAASAALAFAFNLLLRLGNFVAGYFGVLFALASGIYVLTELALKLRELARLTAGRGGR